MIEWWGPILHEYFASSEGLGMTLIDSAEWMRKPGSVGRPAFGILHVCDDAGKDLPTGEVGLVYVERDVFPFAYHNDPEKTRRSQHPEHANWGTTGDIGYLDEDGYLFFLTRGRSRTRWRCTPRYSTSRSSASPTRTWGSR
jgi:long-chain acyl-CoA synthetase